MGNSVQVRLTISIPEGLRDALKAKAMQEDRSFSREIVRCLKAGAAAGGYLGGSSPAAGSEAAAR